MIVLSASRLAKAYDDHVLFQDVTLGVSTDDHVGVVGRNGAGKSTLLRILAEDETPDEGEVVLRNEARVSWLPQEPRPPAGATAMDVVRHGQEAVVPEHEVWAMLDVLGVDPERAMGEMSGGQRRRVALARALAAPSDLLILDEPTNHLDVDTVDWLEERLKRRAGGLMMITHDRYFLERLTNRMLEVEGGTVHWHEGTYADMLEARAERLAVSHRQDARRQNLLRKEIAWLRRQPKARGTKPKFREDAARDLMAVDGTPDQKSLDLGTGKRRLGNDVIDAIGLTAGYGDTPIVKNVDLAIAPGQRIGIVGPNGSGKTTLLRTLLGDLPVLDGEVKRGVTVELGVYRQDATVPDDDTHVLASILQIGERIPLANGDNLPAGRLAERFGFDDRLQFTPIRRLSGGERRRLALLHVLIAAPNVIVLDEPTNDLDLDTLAAMEDYLDGFKGTLLVASHDRFVLDRLTDVLFSVEDGELVQYLDWSHYREAHKAKEVAAERAKANAAPKVSTSKLDNKRRQELVKAVRSLDGRMKKATKKRDDIDVEFAKAGTSPDRLQALGEERKSLTTLLDELEVAWLAASEELEG